MILGSFLTNIDYYQGLLYRPHITYYTAFDGKLEAIHRAWLGLAYLGDVVCQGHLLIFSCNSNPATFSLPWPGWNRGSGIHERPAGRLSCLSRNNSLIQFIGRVTGECRADIPRDWHGFIPSKISFFFPSEACLFRSALRSGRCQILLIYDRCYRWTTAGDNAVSLGVATCKFAMILNVPPLINQAIPRWRPSSPH